MRKVSTEEYKQSVEKLEKESQLLISSIIDLKARSMHDNLIFFNIKKTQKKKTQQLLYTSF